MSHCESPSQRAETTTTILLDGGLGTELERQGHVLSDRLWSARLLRDAPQAIAGVHAEYLQAGADVIATASYQASWPGFREAGLSKRIFVKLLSESVHIAKEQRDEFWKHDASQWHRPRPRIAASIGPYGAYLANGAEYTGDYRLSDEQLHEFHADRWNTLAECKPDLMLCETIPSRREARMLGQLANHTWLQQGIPTWISFSCRDALHISDGNTWASCLEMLNTYCGIQAVGANCLPPSLVADVLRELRQSTDKRLIVYPNSGEQWDASNRVWTGQRETQSFARSAFEWRSMGASIIGGCCRTTPSHIRAIAQQLAESETDQP